jgi:hypothetical protein
MKNVYLSCILFFICILLACNTRKKTQKEKLDTTIITKEKNISNASTVMVDSFMSYNVIDFITKNVNKNLTVDKLKVTEEFVDEPLEYRIDSLRLIGDTIKAVSDSVELSLYKNTTGKLLATIKQSNKKRKTIEIEGIKLSTATTFDSGKGLSASNWNSTTNVNRNNTTVLTNDTKTSNEIVNKDKKSNPSIIIVLISGLFVFLILYVIDKKFKK